MRRLWILGLFSTIVAGGCSGDATITPGDSGRANALAVARTAYAFSHATMAAQIGAVGATPHDWTYLPALDLYQRGVTVDETTTRIEIAKTPESPLLGTIVAQVIDPFPLPTSAVMTVDVTLHSVHSTGTITGTLISETERRQIGNLQFTPPSGTLQYDLTLNETTGAITGTLTASVNGKTATFSNLSKTDGTHAYVEISGSTVQVTWHDDGSGNLITPVPEGGSTTMQWDSSGAGTITYPGGYTEPVTLQE